MVESSVIAAEMRGTIRREAVAAGPEGARAIRRAVVFGGGNAACALSADLALAGIEVGMLEHPGRRSRLAGVAERGSIDIVRNGARRTVPIDLVTQDAARAASGADLVVIAVPAYAHRACAELLTPHLTGDETIVVFTASLGGLEFVEAARRAGRPHRGLIVEAENLPYTCRTTGPAEVVIHIDVPTVVAAAFPAERTAEAEARLAVVFPTLRFGRNILEPLLNNMNGVVHPPVVLMNLPVMERARGEPWWIWEIGVTPAVARVIESLDEERRGLGSTLGLSLEPVADLLWRSGYGPRGTAYETINGCAALRKVRGPADTGHRWFTEDIPYTLALWADLARAVGQPAPVMDALCGLAGAVLGRDVKATGRRLADLGLGGLDRDGLLARLETGRLAP